MLGVIPKKRIKMNNCIWCSEKVHSNSLEHIIPEALGCPDGFVLNDFEICNSCNNRFGNIDLALINAFDIFAFFSGVPRKNGKSPVVNSKGNLYAHITDNGPKLHINMNNQTVTSEHGVKLGGYGKSKQNVKGNIDVNGESATSNITYQFGDDPKMVRALYKIGVETLVYYFGREVVSNSSFDSIKEYVMKGVGERRVIVKSASDTKYMNKVYPPYERKGSGYCVQARIACAEFMIDLTEKEVVIPELEQELARHCGKQGWSILPVKV